MTDRELEAVHKTSEIINRACVVLGESLRNLAETFTKASEPFVRFGAELHAANERGVAARNARNIIIGPHQPCRTFTAETGLPDADEPVIVEANP